VPALCDHIGEQFVPAMLEVTRTNTPFADESAADSGDPEVTRGIVSTSRDRWRTELSKTEIWVGERVFGKLMLQFDYRPADRAVVPSPVELAGILAVLPGRLFNQMFRSPKPFRMAKLKRVLAFLRPHSSP
jgi:hypothetical protein